MEKENIFREVFAYSISDLNGNKIINLFFTVEFFEIEDQKYLENKKSRILVEADDFESGREYFADVIDRKVRESIMRNDFYSLLEAWNLKLRNSEKIDSIEENLNTKEAKIDFGLQLRYSAAMINSFEEDKRWTVQNES